jgi:hypothetical protein
MYSDHVCNSRTFNDFPSQKEAHNWIRAFQFYSRANLDLRDENKLTPVSHASLLSERAKRGVSLFPAL